MKNNKGRGGGLINFLSLKRGGGLLEGEGLFERGGLNRVNGGITVLDIGSKEPQTPPSVGSLSPDFFI